MTVQSLCDQALRLHQQGHFAQAELLYRQALEKDPAAFTPHHLLGILKLQQGQYEKALDEIGAALQINPRSAEALINHGNALKLAGRNDEALASFDKALEARPGFASAPYNSAILLADLGRFEEALESYGKAIALRPDFIEALQDRALQLQRFRRPKEALRDFDRLVALKPDFAENWNNRTVLLEEMGRLEEALASAERARALDPGHAGAWHNRANVLTGLQRMEEALASYDRALTIQPEFFEALHNRGNALNSLKHYEAALASYDRALAIKPDAYARAWTNRGIVLQNLRRFHEAMASFTSALQIEPSDAEALGNRGRLAWVEFRDYDGAVRDLEQAVARDPDFPYVRGYLLHVKKHGGDWEGLEQEVTLIDAGVRAGKPVVEPFVYQGLNCSPADLKACATAYAARCHPAAPPLHPKTRLPGKIKVGYVSGEFREQATAYLTAGLYECHDRTEFEIIAFDNGPSDGSPIRKRLEAGFDKFLGISRLSDAAAAALIAQEGIDILVNLNGYFGESRTGIFAHRPAPIQVNYLGFPGTLGAAYMDYIIADETVIPQGEEQHYTEAVVRLPNSYQVNDSRRPIAEETPSHAACDLPMDGFVFCNFNNSYKLAPEIFARWMAILNAVPGSILWLLEGHPRFAENIRREAEARGVAGNRIIFAPQIRNEKYLARAKLADLFLDNLPYNAHTTASDALWVGLPLITCRGQTFPGRVAASLLQAIGLCELVTEDLDSYQALAVKLASDPRALRSVREKLAHNRLSTPLFDTKDYTKHLEAAYRTMLEIRENADGPRSFTVPPAG